MDGPCIPIFAYAASPQKLVCNILRISKVMGGLLTPPTNTAINLTFLRSFFCLLKFPHHTIPYFVMSSEMIEFGTLSLQTNTKCYSYYPIHNIGHVNMQNKKTHHTVHLYDILLNTITSFPSPALNSTIRIPTSTLLVGNIPNGYNRTCPLLRLLVRQQARVPVGQQVRQSGTFPTGRAQTALTIIRYQPSYSLPLFP